MSLFVNLDYKKQIFFNFYFGDHLNHESNLDWKTAYLNFCAETRHDEAAYFAEKLMDNVYVIGNLLNSLTFLPPLLSVLPIVAIVWNAIDAVGACLLAIRDGRKQDTWSRNANLISSVQLTMATVLFGLINYLKMAPALVVTLSPLGVAASGFAFATAMIISWALAHRQVKLHRARIKYLDTKICGLEKELTENLHSCQALKKNEDKIHYLEKFSSSIEGNAQLKQDIDLSNKVKDLLTLLNFKEHQEKQLEIHVRNRRVWKLCSVCMLAVAIVSTISSLFIITSPAAMIILAATSCVALLVSGIYRNHPDFFGMCNKPSASNLIKTGLFRSIPTSQPKPPLANSLTPKLTPSCVRS